jgi:hypothetical protein
MIDDRENCSLQLIFYSLGLHRRCSGTASFGNCSLAFQSETWLVSAASAVHIPTVNDSKPVNEKDTTMNKVNSQNEVQKSNSKSLIRKLTMGVLMVTLVGRPKAAIH